MDSMPFVALHQRRGHGPKMTDNVKKIIAFFLLGFLSVVGNALNVELFFGARLVFSSVFVIIALFTLGPWYGVGVAFFGGLYTIVL